MPKRLGKFELPTSSPRLRKAPARPTPSSLPSPSRPATATTVGNSLRRVLAQLHRGAAISSIKIEGVQHEFQSIEGVRRGCHRHRPEPEASPHRFPEARPIHRLTIKANAEGPVTAADIQPDPAIHVMNPEQVICTLDKARPFEGRDRDQDRPRLLPGREQQEGGPAHRGHRDRLPLQSGPPGPLYGREHARRPDHRLRQAAARNLDRRPHHAGRCAQNSRLDPQTPPRCVRPGQ